jgi:Spy/CpxP family protein refolding chaperone
MKRTLISAAVAAAALLAIPATAQMMGGYGGYGPGYGMGPGTMGPGMMGGYEGYGPGYGMGPGMMGGYGPGMMGGYGRGGYGAALNLTDEQRDKIAEIQRDLAQKRWTLMASMHEQRFAMFKSGAADDATLRKSFQAMQETQKQMFEASLDAGKRMEAVLTPEQRKQLPRGFGRLGMMMW